MKFYIFRHGETLQTKTGVGYADKQLTAGIIPEGIPAIKRQATFLKDIVSEYNVASPLFRVQETVKIIKEITGKEFTTDKRIGEIMWDKDPDSNLFPYTESFSEFKARIEDFLKDLKEKEYDTVIIGTHGGIIAALKHLIVKGEFDEENIVDFPPPGVLTIIKGKEMEEIDFNEK